MQLNVIRGIKKRVENKLNKEGISSVEGLLAACALKKDRVALAKQTGIEESLLLDWANRADLARIEGIAGKFAELLEDSGVDTVPALAMRNPENLLLKLKEVNDAKKIVKQLPGLSQIQEWIKQAGKLPRVINY